MGEQRLHVLYEQELSGLQKALFSSILVRYRRWQQGLKIFLFTPNGLSTGEDLQVYASALFETEYGYESLSDWNNARLY
jgi:hypothetical protein